MAFSISKCLRLLLCWILLSTLGLPAAHGETTFRFFAFGDWGSGDHMQRKVAQQLKRICQNHACDFGLSLGDNFYPAGVSGVEDPQWKKTFQDVYGDIKVPFYAALGNHDDRGSIQAQIDYSKINPLWIMPDRQFSFQWPSAGSPLLEIFVIDSNQFDQKDATWLKKALDQSKATWKFLALHHPILNNGSKHPPDQKNLYPLLKPVICKKIDLILSGHEHIFSHLKDSSDPCGWEQIILGTGGARLYGLTANPPPQYKVLASEASHGIGYFEVTPHRLRFQFIRETGAKAYETEWKKGP